MTFKREKENSMTDNLKRLLACGALLACGFVNAAEPWQVVTINAVTWVGKLKGGADFEVRIEARKPKDSRADYIGAGEQPELAVAEITVKAGDEKIKFPKLAFEDLANPLLQTLSATSQPSGELKVRFLGGESAATYEVEYLIQSKKLTTRTVKYFETTATGEKNQVVKTMDF
jgi:hypothetical protein